MIAIGLVVFPVRKLSRDAAVIWSRVARLQLKAFQSHRR